MRKSLQNPNAKVTNIIAISLMHHIQFDSNIVHFTSFYLQLFDNWGRHCTLSQGALPGTHA